MNKTLLADIVSTILDDKGVEIDGNRYWLEVFSEEGKIIFLVSSEEEDEVFDYYAIVEDSMV